MFYYDRDQLEYVVYRLIIIIITFQLGMCLTTRNTLNTFCTSYKSKLVCHCLWLILSYYFLAFSFFLEFHNQKVTSIPLDITFMFMSVYYKGSRLTLSQESQTFSRGYILSFILVQIVTCISQLQWKLPKQVQYLLVAGYIAAAPEFTKKQILFCLLT